MAELSNFSNLSLEENEPSTKTKEIEVGPFPAGRSAAPNDEALGQVQSVAGKGTIFDRRFARQEAFHNRPRQKAWLAPIFIPNVPFDAPLAISPGRNSSRTMRAEPGFSPLPPPAKVLGYPLDFARCDSTRCGDADRVEHHISVNEGKKRLDLGYDWDTKKLDTQKGGKDEWTHCDTCGEPELRRLLHKLQCGHLICDGDLYETAAKALEIAKNPDPLTQTRLEQASYELHRLNQTLVPQERMPATWAGQKAHIIALEKELLGILGLSCCGMDMQIVKEWIICLDEWLARELWTVTWKIFEGAWKEDTVECGWCDAAIPDECSWKGWDGEMRWTCVACQGNSMFHYRSGGLWPAR